MEQQTNEMLLPDGKKGDLGEQKYFSVTVLESKSSEYSEQQSLDQLENVQERQNISKDSDEEVPTYSNLVFNNRPFRLYLASYLITTAGE